MSIATVELIGTLEAWSDWEQWKPVVRAPLIPALYFRMRYTRLMFGYVEAARITEYERDNGISQFVVFTIGGPRPSLKFWSFELALDYLKQAIEGNS